MTLPKGMALIETADGRWFPALTSLTDTPRQVTFLDAGARCILPTREAKLCHDSRQGYCSRKKALEACRAWDEEMHLPVQWEELAAHTEVYPDRNAWYLEEIAQMTGESPLLLIATTEAVAAIIVELHPGVKIISAAGVTRDEAIEQLYQHVHAWLNELAEVRAS